MDEETVSALQILYISFLNCTTIAGSLLALAFWGCVGGFARISFSARLRASEFVREFVATAQMCVVCQVEALIYSWYGAGWPLFYHFLIHAYIHQLMHDMFSSNPMILFEEMTTRKLPAPDFLLAIAAQILGYNVAYACFSAILTSANFLFVTGIGGLELEPEWCPYVVQNGFEGLLIYELLAVGVFRIIFSQIGQSKFKWIPLIYTIFAFLGIFIQGVPALNPIAGFLRFYNCRKSRSPDPYAYGYRLFTTFIPGIGWILAAEILRRFRQQSLPKTKWLRMVERDQKYKRPPHAAQHGAVKSFQS